MKEKASTIEYHFDAAAARNRMAEEIKKPASRQALSKGATGISGGKNSAVTADGLSGKSGERLGPTCQDIRKYIRFGTCEKALNIVIGLRTVNGRAAAFRLNRDKECFQP